MLSLSQIFQPLKLPDNQIQIFEMNISWQNQYSRFQILIWEKNCVIKQLMRNFKYSRNLNSVGKYLYKVSNKSTVSISEGDVLMSLLLTVNQKVIRCLLALFRCLLFPVKGGLMKCASLVHLNLNAGSISEKSRK